MAISFLDTILVNSGTGSASTIVAAGARPITLTGGAIGSVAIGGSNGGWATGYLFTGYSGTNRGGFGALGNADALSYYYIGDAYNDTTMVVQPNAGSVGIGTTAPAQKLTVAGTIMSTGSSNPTFILQDTTHSDITIKGDSGIFSVANASAGQNITMLYNGNVGIGTTAPVDKLHVSSGMIRVEGIGCGIRMPDTSGNPLLALTTDQNTFAGCNIVNGWGNSLNTGVGVGTTRSDGTAFQVRTGITLSSGIATNSGTTRFIVNGNGNVGIGTTNPVAKLQVNGTFTSAGVSNVGTGANTSVYLTASSGTGKVGVGTTSPAEKLDVNGNVKASGYKTSSGTGVTTNVTVRNQNNSNTVTFQIVGGIIVGIT